jgi:hypothetical protein
MLGEARPLLPSVASCPESGIGCRSRHARSSVVVVAVLLVTATCNQDREPLVPSPAAPDSSVQAASPVPEPLPPRASGSPEELMLPGRACETGADCTWWQDPDPKIVCCGGQCINTARDPRNCGACGTMCPSGQVCSDGACREAGPACGAVQCGGGEICCGGRCVVPISSSDCGGCGIACRFGGGGCASGNCCAWAPVPDSAPACQPQAMCPGWQASCDRVCVDLATDPDNCGGCGRGCPSSLRRCLAGICNP